MKPGYAMRFLEPASGRSMGRRRRRRRCLGALAAAVAVVIAFAGAAWALAGRAAAPGRPMAPGRPVAAGRSSGSDSPGAVFPRVSALAGPRSASASAAVLAQPAAAQAAAIDRTIAATSFVRVAGRQHREIALTFDDGPGPYTPAILSELERAHVPATFFAVGVLERYFHDATTREIGDGDVVGDHTFTHAAMGQLRVAVQRTQLLGSARAVERYGAPFPRLFRPPYGTFNAATLALLRRYRMLMVLWTVDTHDYRRPGVRAIVRAAVAGARPGAIILFHDAGGDRSETVAAVPEIIAALRRRGYTLVTVPRLLADDPTPAHQTLAAMPTGGG